MARPKKSADELLSETARFRLTLAEREALRSSARTAGLSEAEFIRRRVLGLPVSPVRSFMADPALINAVNNHAVALREIGHNVNQLTAATHQGRSFVRFWREIGDELRADLRAGRKALKSALASMDQ
jgi:mobilization protein NikA